MASKRMKNRVYWAIVKAATYHPNTELHANLASAWYAAAKQNQPDSAILTTWESDLLTIEEQHGPAGLRNVHNRDLWPVRERYAMSNN